MRANEYSPLIINCSVCAARIGDWCLPYDGEAVWDVETGDFVHQERIAAAAMLFPLTNAPQRSVEKA